MTTTAPHPDFEALRAGARPILALTGDQRWRLVVDPVLEQRLDECDREAEIETARAAARLLDYTERTAAGLPARDRRLIAEAVATLRERAVS